MTEIGLKIEMAAFDERTAGDIGLQRDLLSCFESEFAGLRNSLSDNVLKRDFQAVASGLHKLKGSVGLFGFVNVTDYISSLENRLKTDLDADLSAFLKDLFLSIEKHIVELKKCIY